VDAGADAVAAVDAEADAVDAEADAMDAEADAVDAEARLSTSAASY
jgi:hypothetical protein